MPRCERHVARVRAHGSSDARSEYSVGCESPPPRFQAQPPAGTCVIAPHRAIVAAKRVPQKVLSRILLAGPAEKHGPQKPRATPYPLGLLRAELRWRVRGQFLGLLPRH